MVKGEEGGGWAREEGKSENESEMEMEINWFLKGGGIEMGFFIYVMVVELIWLGE